MTRTGRLHLYTTLAAAQHYGRISGNWTEEQDEVYNDELGTLWFDLDQEERAVIKETVETLNRVEERLHKMAGRDPDNAFSNWPR